MESEIKVEEPAPKYGYISPEIFWEINKRGENRLEYYDGYVVGFEGVSWQHDKIEQNLSLILGNFLDGKGCDVMGPGMPVGTASNKFYMYPDRLILCEEMILKLKPRCLLNPTVIFEVLSPSTKKYDETIKLNKYREIPSLQEYIMIDSQKIKVKVARRVPGPEWPIKEIDNRESILFIGTIGYHLPLQEIYKGTGL